MAKNSWCSQPSDYSGRQMPRNPAWAFVLALVLALPVSAQQSVSTPPTVGQNQLREAAEPYLSSYALSAEQKQSAGELVQRFSGDGAGRVAYDVRTEQLIAYGPAAFHQQLQQALAAPAPGPPPVVRRLPVAGEAAPPAPAVVASPMPGEATASEAPAVYAAGSPGLHLRTLDAAGLHSRLEQLVARPLPATWDASNEWLSFPLSSAEATEATVEVHRTSGEVRLRGEPATVAGWQRVIGALDSPPAAGNRVTRLASTRHAPKDRLRQALQILSNQSMATGTAPHDETMTVLLQQPEPPAGQPAPPAEQPAQAPGTEPAPEGTQPPGEEAEGTLLGPVRIEFVEGLDVIVVEGNQRDVERVLKIIEQIESLSAETMPAIEIVPLEHVDSVSLAQLLTQVYDRVLGPRTGTVSITPLGQPNALLLIGRTENVQRAIELVKRLDQPVTATSRFEYIPLKYAAAEEAKTVIDQFLQEQQQQQQPQPQQTPPLTLAPRALVVADYRSNALIVRASPRDMAEIKAIIERLDTNQVAAVDEVRVFQLKNTVAPELAETLRAAIAGQIAPGQPGQPGQAPTTTGGGARSTALQFIMIDAETQQRLQSGILTNVRIAADQRANAIVVTAPPDSMSLIAALIAQLDRAPTAEAELKVFTIANGDAQSLADMLRGLFAPAEGEAAGGGGLGGAAGALVPLQFSVDARTNSIIVAGSAEDLAVVEAILLRLDSSDMRQRTTTVYRLKNAPAEDVAIALNDWLRTEREAEAAAELAISPFEQIEREVVIVPELVSNSLIVSATPRFFDEIRKLIEQLDERPPMVMIQVLIAEVEISDLDEFGVELGLQDSLLFDRSVIDTTQFLTITNSVQDTGAGGAVTTVTQQQIVNQPLTPGFNFNNTSVPLGNNGSTSALATAGKVAAQGLSNFGVGRVSSNSDFGGFVLSASSNSINFLLRALQESRRLEILSRPQIMALDNQEGIINVGQRVPRVTSVNQNQFGQTNSVVYEQVGIILRVRPRISPDGLVVMEIYANKSELTASTIPIAASVSGDPLTAPIIRNLEAQTTVSATSGQTVVLSGLLTKDTRDVHRRVPLIADIPLIGDLFRYDSVQERRTELLIILTPRIVRDHLDAEMIKQVESSRMSWVLCDVITMNGPSGLRSRCDEWGDAETCAVYPTHVPKEGDVIPLTPPEGPAMPLEPPVDPNLPAPPLSELPRPLDEQIAPAGYGYDGAGPKEVRYATEGM